MVFDRTLVLAADQDVTLEVVGEEPGLISADGRETGASGLGARVRAGVAPNPGLVVWGDETPPFHARVGEKSGLPDGMSAGAGSIAGCSGSFTSPGWGSSRTWTWSSTPD